jgi:hypothetical protein
MFALAQQTFLAKKNCKKPADLDLDKVIYYKGTFLLGSTKPLSQHASSSTKISMVRIHTAAEQWLVVKMKWTLIKMAIKL